MKQLLAISIILLPILSVIAVQLWEWLIPKFITKFKSKFKKR